MNSPRPRPSVSRRLAAAGAVLLVIAVAVLTVVGAIARPAGFFALVMALVAIALASVWYGISRAGARRDVAAAIALATVLGLVAVMLSAPGWPLAIRIALLVLAIVLGRYALARDVRTLKSLETAGTPVPAARRGALIMNPSSGGGKAERSHLEDECRRRGIEPIVLRPGLDLLDLARDAIDRGADVIGMAGGDGSQALVASVAAARGIPMVVVPAGTRNHLALDLGLDRNDVVGAIDAFGEAVERTIDLADVNGRVFVNNVSLGLYATIVRSPGYRDAKIDTTLAALPTALGPGTQPYALAYQQPDGTQHESAHLIQVTNGPYGDTLGGAATRPRLDTGTLGIVTLVIPDDRAGRRLLHAVAAGRPRRYEGLTVWSTPRFRVDAPGPVDAGLDGEAVQLDPPLVFSSRPGALRVRLPGHAIGSSPAARSRGWRGAASDLWRTALGRSLEPAG